MYLVSNAIYEIMAQHLRDEIGSASYYSGVVEFSHVDEDNQEVECRLVASLIIYRSPCSTPEGDIDIISNIVPVWSEFHTIVDSEQKINDFDITELKNNICTWI